MQSNGNQILSNSFENDYASSSTAEAVDISAASNNEVRLNAVITGANGTMNDGIIVQNNGPTTATNNNIEGNYLSSKNASAGETAIWIDGATGTKVAMNVIEGNFDTGIDVSSPATGTWVDNNSIYLATTDSPVTFDGSTNDCYRNNIVEAKVPMTLKGVTSANDFSGCTPVTGNNAFLNSSNGGQCTPGSGGSCVSLCPGPLCNLTTTAQDFNFASSAPGLCLPGGSPFINSAVAITCGATTPCYDMVDDTPNVLTFEGSAADVGARESGAKRVYGAPTGTAPAPFSSNCP